MLGVYLASDGTFRIQIDVLRKKAEKWAQRVDHSYLIPHEAMTAYVQVLFPALVYPLGVCSITEQECDFIVQPAIKALLKN